MLSPQLLSEAELCLVCFLAALLLSFASSLWEHAMLVHSHHQWLLRLRDKVAFRFYGVWEVPLLPVWAFVATGVVFLVSLGNALFALVVMHYPAYPAFLIAMASYFLCFGQLRWCSGRANGHKAMLIPGIFAVAMPLVVQHGSAQHSWLPYALKAIPVSAYFGSALCKLKSSWRSRRLWMSGEAMQVYCLMTGSAMFRGSDWLQFLRFSLASRRWIAAAMSLAAVSFELAAPLALINASLASAWAVTGFVFHIAVHVTMGVDFVTYWSTALALFVPDILHTIGASPVSREVLMPPLLAGAAHERLAVLLSVSYVVTQCCVALLSTERLMPLTCASMFARAVTFHDWASEEIPVWFVERGQQDRVDFYHGVHVREDMLYLPYKVVRCAGSTSLDNLNHDAAEYPAVRDAVHAASKHVALIAVAMDGARDNLIKRTDAVFARVQSAMEACPRARGPPRRNGESAARASTSASWVGEPQFHNW